MNQNKKPSFRDSSLAKSMADQKLELYKDIIGIIAVYHLVGFVALILLTIELIEKFLSWF